jgi:hypothetical protein
MARPEYAHFEVEAWIGSQIIEISLSDFPNLQPPKVQLSSEHIRVGVTPANSDDFQWSNFLQMHVERIWCITTHIFLS